MLAGIRSHGRNGEQSLKTYCGEDKPLALFSCLLRLCLYVKVVDQMGGTGFGGQGHCPAGADGSAVATECLSEYCYLGLAPASGQEHELDVLRLHEDKEADKHFVIFIYLFLIKFGIKFSFHQLKSSSLDYREEDPNFMHFSIIPLHSCDQQVVTIFLFLVAACRDLIKRRNSL